jgi:DNA-binding NarL/FixJ family response regulator
MLVVEDQELFREMLVKACREGGFTVAGAAVDGAEAIKMAGTLKPDLVLLDIELPKVDGFGVIQAVRAARPRTKIVALSSVCNAFTAHRIARANIEGFIDKNFAALATFRKVLGQVADGGSYYSESYVAARKVLNADGLGFDRTLSDRQVQVLVMVGNMQTDPEIAAIMGVSCDMVEKHRLNIGRRIGTKTRVEMVRWAVENGFRTSVVRPSGAQKSEAQPPGGVVP